MIDEFGTELSFGGRLIVNFVEVVIEVPVEDLSLADSGESLNECLEGVLALSPEDCLLVHFTDHFVCFVCLYS